VKKTLVQDTGMWWLHKGVINSYDHIIIVLSTHL
jgi:hypothetical protein